MEGVQVYRNRASADQWRPSSVTALASSADGSRVAAARADGSLEIWLVSPGSVGWHCQLTIQGDPESRVSSLVWCVCGSKSGDSGRLFSSSIDGSVSEWDLFSLTQKSSRASSGRARNGTVVSADSAGSVQFWDSGKGALLQAHSFHKGDANALAATPSHNRVFSAGSDGQVILYKHSNEMLGSEQNESSTEVTQKWVYVGYVRAHTHDVRALTLTVPISEQDSSSDDKVSRPRRRQKPISYSYHKWAQMGVPMLISAGDDTKLFAYSAGEFTKFSPHDICPAPQRLPIHLVLNTAIDGASTIMVQSSCSVDVLPIRLRNTAEATGSGKNATTQLLARVKSKGSRKIISSTISSTGLFFAYSDNVKPNLFELKHEIACLFLLEQIVNVHKEELLHTFEPCRKADDMKLPPAEPPIMRMFTSSDGQWLAAVNCFGDIYVFHLETQRQHWFISRLNGASVTAGGFPPGKNNILIITTSSNKVYAFDVEAKQLGEWSRHNTFVLPRRFQEFPGEVIGLTFPPSSSSSVIVYSTRAMCLIDFGLPVDEDDKVLTNGFDTILEKKCYDSNIAKLKRKWKDISQNHKPKGRKNFEFYAFKDPVLFVSHLSDKALLIIDKPWLDVVRTFDAPVHRHIFGT
ncbi:hypothetical protein QJS04_geneDACA009505 [Acorus gramineus]|uniref:Cirhin n=1 Tax=Acorus gramineus TaxID=55184 RepID=A0AAV9AIT8_ACOGR|nr:hypothetical protein QJS04_geneDACA009505 [Acorus gramineus]